MAVYREVAGVGAVTTTTGLASYEETQTFTANAAVTVSHTSANVGDRLIIVLVVDGTGGWQITSWDALLKGVTVNDFDNAANYENLYEFVWRGSAWWLLSRISYNA